MSAAPAATGDGRAPRLSLCMIVRDEERFLGACLDSVAAYADEMVVVDTGSTDRTARLAQDAGARVLHYPWTEDFAAARNRSLAAASGDWILVLDADERLPAEAGARLRRLLQAPPSVAGYLLQQRTPTPSSGSNGMVRTECLPRLFRNGIGARYVGAVHECVLPSLAGAGRILHAGVVIEHDGYLQPREALRKKALRNLQILRRETRRHPADALTWIQVGDCHASLEDVESAVGAYRTGLGLIEAGSPAAGATVPRPTVAMAWQQLGAGLLIRGAVEEAVRALDRALALCPALASARLYRGQALARRGDWDGAIEEYARAIATAAGPTPPDAPVQLLPWFAWHLKGAAEAAVGRDGAAIASLETTLRLHPACRDAQQLLTLLRRVQMAARGRGAAPAAPEGGRGDAIPAAS